MPHSCLTHLPRYQVSGCTAGPWALNLEPTFSFWLLLSRGLTRVWSVWSHWHYAKDVTTPWGGALLKSRGDDCLSPDTVGTEDAENPGSTDSGARTRSPYRSALRDKTKTLANCHVLAGLFVPPAGSLFAKRAAAASGAEPTFPRSYITTYHMLCRAVPHLRISGLVQGNVDY